MASPHRSSSALRDLAGTNRPDRQAPEAGAEYEIATILPKCPAWLCDKWAVEEYHRLGPILLQVGLLTKGNIPTFWQLCAAYGELCSTYEQRLSPKAATIGQYFSAVGHFGLTPATAGKVRAPDPVQKGNAFRSNGKPSR